ncbi:hypothetical protein [Massilia sp. YIM B04103]|uniref:hypothetical protein n=1 Tax=Massilia sp. YIM B04103 TaxID=2963106 RepID=UPI00210C5C3C|nr:hypothetical protein [Massilia sp. YIM B04103]
MKLAKPERNVSLMGVKLHEKKQYPCCFSLFFLSGSLKQYFIPAKRSVLMFYWAAYPARQAACRLVRALAASLALR